MSASFTTTERDQLMLTSIHAYIKAHHQVTLSDLAQEFNAKESTMLHYVRALVEDCLIHRVQTFSTNHALGRIYTAGPRPYGPEDDLSEPLQVTIHRWEPQRSNPTLLEALFFAPQGASA